ncbi:MAG TPA: CopG family transcriptional regulator [Acidimicrobiales bacterium]|nr:CopG family transcriptional regulator [Acidimicrobiales bacterium]
MERTQIYLSAEELALLDQAAETTGASRSELIRRAIRSTFGTVDKAQRLLALQASAGSFRHLRGSGADYVDAVRGDLNERLGTLGLS